MRSPATAPVLWPADVRRSGWFYGWRHPAMCVAGVLEAHSSEDAQSSLESSTAHACTYGDLAQMFDAPPSILGRCAFDGAAPFPRLEYQEPDDQSRHVIFFRRPNLRRMQLYTLDSQVSLFAQPRHVDEGSTKHFADVRGVDPSSLSVNRESLLTQMTINQMNYGQLYDRDVFTRVAKSRISLSHARQLGSGLSYVAESKLGWWRSTIMSTIPHPWLSSVKQLSTRVAQILSLMGRVPLVNALVTVKTISEYVTFYNYVWLILNDVIIGSAIGSVVCEQSELISSTLDYGIRRLLIGDLQRALVWLNNWPAGLKLNSELSQFYCHLLLGVVVGWNKVLEMLVLPYLNLLIYAVGVLGTCGITMSLCLLSDMLLITTAHTYVCYALSRAVYRRQLDICGSLWSLFRGKRYNILRRRVDSWSYDVDQLLFGTIIFTLIAFVFPTTMAYYMLFASIHLATLCISAILETVLFLVNHFPLFALLLRFKDPERLPSGIVLKQSPTSGTVIVVNKPISLAAIFAHYRVFHSSLSARFHPLRLVLGILRGNLL